MKKVSVHLAHVALSKLMSESKSGSLQISDFISQYFYSLLFIFCILFATNMVNQSGVKHWSTGRYAQIAWRENELFLLFYMR